MTEETRQDSTQANVTRKGDNYPRGIAHIIGAAFCFSLMTVFLKKSGDLPTMQKAFFRNFIAMLLAVSLLLKTPDKFKFHKGSRKYVLLRAIFGTLGLICNFWAVDHLVLADSNMLNKMSPFFAMVMSIFILKEKASRFDWFAIIVAFIGVIFIVKPTTGIASLPSLVGLAGGFGAGTAYTFLRRATSAGERSELIVFAFSAFSCIVTLPFFIFNYQTMTWQQLCLLLLTGVAAMGGQLNITTAYKYAPAKVISVFDYLQVIFAAIWGFIIFSEKPDPYSIVGYIIIIGVAVLKWYFKSGVRQKR